MAAITICSDFGAPQNKVRHCFHCFPIYFPWSDGTGCHDLCFWMLIFKPTFSLSSFTFIKRLFSSSFCHKRIVSSAYLRLLIFLPAILIPTCASSSPAFLMECPLDCKEIQPVHSKGNQSWVFFGRTDAKAETLILWPPHAKSWLIGKDSDAGRDWGQEEKGTTEDEMAGWHHWLEGRECESTPGVGGGQGGLACCNSWDHRVGHDWVTELNWADLDCKEIQPVHPKGNQFWMIIGRTYVEAETPIVWPPDAKNWLIWKDPDAGKDWRQEKGTTEWDGWMASPTQWTWVWINSGS